MTIAVRAIVIVLFCLLSKAVMASSSPLVQASSPYHASRWLWEPITRLEPQSHKAVFGQREEQGQTITLEAGGAAVLRLSQSHWLRLLAMPGAEDATPVLSYSQGNGLFVPARLQRGRAGGEWLLAPMTNTDAILVLENRTAVSTSWMLSRTRPDNRTQPYPYRETNLSPGDDSQWHFQPAKGAHLQLSALAAGDDYRVVVKGPGEFRLEARTLFGSQKNWQRFIDLPLHLNNAYWRDWRLHPRVNHYDVLESGQCQKLSSHAESLYLTLGEGEHTVSFTAPQEMAVRMVGLNQQDFLFKRNQPTPGAAEISEHFRVRSAPTAQAPYDENLYAALLSDKTPFAVFPSYAAQISPAFAPRIAAAALIEQRFRFWRTLPVANAARDVAQVRLVDVVLAKPHKGNKRYVVRPDSQPYSKQSMLGLAPGATIELEAPDQRPNTTLKLSLPFSALRYELTLQNRRGEITTWQWRPQYIQTAGLDVANSSDLTRLATRPGGNELATASATVQVAAQDFPIRLSHNGAETIWFSASYRDDVGPSLSPASWERALTELGPDAMLALLISDRAPATSLEAKVWKDWLPLRRWLYSYRLIWSKGLDNEALTPSPIRSQQLRRLIAKLESDSGHLLKRVLKGVVVNDQEPQRRQLALQWLHKHYRQVGDRANLSAYHSWHFKHAPEHQLQALADWLVIVGLEKMAVRIYRLSDTPASHLPYQQARLHSDWSRSADGSDKLVATWEAVWRQDWAGAGKHGVGLNIGHQWREFVNKAPLTRNAVSWLQWAQQAPAFIVDGEPAATATRLAPSDSADTLNFYVSARELHMERALALPDEPVRYSVNGPVDLQLTVNLHHRTPLEVLNDWVEIDVNGNKKWWPVIDSKVNEDITQLPQSSVGNIGLQKRLTLSFGPGRHELQIRPLEHNILIDARILSPLLLSNLVNSLQPVGAVMPANTLAVSQVVKNLDIRRLNRCDLVAASEQEQTSTTRESGEDPLGAIAEGSQWSAQHTLHSTIAIEKPPERPSFNEIEQYLLQLLWRWPQMNDDQRQLLIASANAVTAPLRDNSHIKPLMNKLNRDYKWRLEEAIVTSAGGRRVDTNGSSENPNIVERENIFANSGPLQGERLHAYENMGFYTRFHKPTEVRITLRQGHLPYERTPTGRVLVTLNDQPIRTITLPPLRQEVSITIPGGPQQLRLQLEHPTADHWVYVQAEINISGQWQSLLEQKQHRYHVATAEQPVEMYFAEPLWLRIDEYRDGNVIQRYQWHRQPGALLLLPEPGRGRAMYRVFSWQPRTGPSALQTHRVAVSQRTDNSIDTRPAYDHDRAFPMPQDYQWSPDQRIGGIARATDGAYLKYQSRRDFDSDAGKNNEERFLDMRWRHRRALDCLACYWRSDLFARHHDDDGIDVVGTDQWLQGDWAQSSWRWALNQSLLLQTGPKTDWAWFGSADAIQTHEINEKLEHQYELQLFGRYLSADNPDYAVDNDIYTAYKDEHRGGIKLASTLRGRPWLDSLWTANAGLSSNEDFNLLQPDYLQAAVTWRQYWRPLALSATYRHRFYLSDSDRENSVHRPHLGLAVNSMTGFGAGQILQWGGRLDYDLDRGEYGFVVSLSWDRSRGRGLQDFNPNRTSFYGLRSRDLDTELQRHQMINRVSHDE